MSLAAFTHPYGKEWREEKRHKVDRQISSLLGLSVGRPHFSICSSASKVLGLVFKTSPFPVTLMSHFR